MITREQLLFTSTACACRPNTLEWCTKTSYIIFASQKTICIVDYDKVHSAYRVIETVEKAHHGEITSLTMLRGRTFGVYENEACSLFCTASSSGESAIWKLQKTAETHCHVTLIKKITKKSGIELSKMATYNSVGNEILLGNLQFDHIDVQFFNLDGDEIGTISTFTFRNAIASTFELSHICAAVVIAVGLSNGMVDIFASELGSYSVQMKLSLDLCGTNKSWTRALAFKELDDVLLSLAAASDGLIKIWQFDPSEKTLPRANDELKLNQQIFCIKDGHARQIAVTLESVLQFQTEPIFSLSWHPNNLELLSSGANQTVIRWSYSVPDSVWLPISRFGEIVGEQISCYDITYSPCGQFALCHSFLGGFHFWQIDAEGVFPKSFPIGGHFAEVTDLCWDPSGTFLFTCSFDMTTRIVAQQKQFEFFFEIARPQTHGHPINCIASIQRNLFVSGGDEKIFRVFQATSSFAQNLALFSDYQPLDFDQRLSSDLPISAFQTELTLTNKAVTELDSADADNEGSGGVICATDSLSFTEPPREDQLGKFTLFPEVHKLYGHGFEVFSCAATHDGNVLATSCKASHFEHAAILLWDTFTWKLMNTLRAHQLTVTRLSFSFDNKFLLSVSRDRTWTLFRLNVSCASPFGYELFLRSEKTQGHGRIIWDCAWCPDAYLFATCSRDKSLKLWSISGGDLHQQQQMVKMISKFDGPEPQTAVDFSPKKSREFSYLIAVGFENGAIFLFEYDTNSHALQLVVEFSTNFAHSGRINRLRFRPVISKKQKDSDHFLLASASDCHTVKIHKINV